MAKSETPELGHEHEHSNSEKYSLVCRKGATKKQLFAVHCDPVCNDTIFGHIIYHSSCCAIRVILVALSFRCFAIWVLALPLLFSFVTNITAANSLCFQYLLELAAKLCY
jgi:hypothetical protein